MVHQAQRSAFTKISDELVEGLSTLSFSEPVHSVYNPLQYARAPWELYCERFGGGQKEVLFLGMNPGPFGMAQTGVPFGEVTFVRDWLKIQASVGKPEKEHPKRPILGFDCPRSEVSGQRLWQWAKDHFGSPEVFFQRFFIYNYCPLVFMGESGKNLVPSRLNKAEREGVFLHCDAALRAVVTLLQPKYVVGIGKFAEGRAKAALSDFDTLRLGGVLHPSPASPKANRGWAKFMDEDLRQLGIELP